MIVSFYLFRSFKLFEQFKRSKVGEHPSIDSKIVVEGKSKGLLGEQTIRDPCSPS
jgi:hypothetical protein